MSILGKILGSKEAPKENVYRYPAATDYFKVIAGTEIEEMEPVTFGDNGKMTELQYRELLEDNQSIFDEYDRTGALPEIKYESFEDIDRLAPEWKRLNDFKTEFMEVGTRIEVEKRISGKYKVTTNGKHRLFIAQKYKMKVMVHVCQEICVKEV